jgi:DNA-binding HxlR family transcriptional regulator
MRFGNSSASESKAQGESARRLLVAEIPKPGSPVRGSESGRPIMALLDLLGRRWALRLIWELRDGPLSFREAQARCGGISSSVLNDRLTELRAAGIVEAADVGYELTREGRELLELYGPLNAWAERWAARERRSR